MYPLLEKEIEYKVVKYCKAHGIYTRKFVSPGHSGVPDRIFAHAGRVLFLEFKRPGQKPTGLQAKELKLLRDAGVMVTWVTSYEDALYEIYTYLEKPCQAI